MGTSILEAFVVTFALQSEGFKKGAKDVEQTSTRTRDAAKKSFGEIEDHGKAMGSAFRSMRNEVAGLFVLLSGTSSLTSFFMQMATGAAGADRLGQTLGMATGKIYAWREAMKSVGGQSGSADSALSTIERAVQAFKMTGSTGMDADLMGLGIGRNDIMSKDPGEILKKIADARGGMDGPQFAARLQRIGLPPDMINLLMKGGGDVRSTLGKYEQNTKALEKAAKETEDLQQSIADLDNSLTKALVPVLKDILPPLKIVADTLTWLASLKDPVYGVTGGKGAKDYAHDALEKAGAKGRLGWLLNPFDWSDPNGSKAPPRSGSFFAFGAQLGRSNVRQVGNTTAAPMGSGRTLADRNRNPGNIRDSAFAKRQPGYSGSNKGFAVFDTDQHGAAAQIALLLSYMSRGRNTIASIISKWAPPGENDTERYIKQVENFTHIRRGAQLSVAQLRLVAQAMSRVEGYHGRGGVTINSMPVTVHTQAKDADGIARSIGPAIRRNVQKADGGMAH